MWKTSSELNVKQKENIQLQESIIVLKNEKKYLENVVENVKESNNWNFKCFKS